MRNQGDEKRGRRMWLLLGRKLGNIREEIVFEVKGR
jgi:hypothetical protein